MAQLGCKEGEGGSEAPLVSAHSRSASRICAERRSDPRTRKLIEGTGHFLCKESDPTYFGFCRLHCNYVYSMKRA